MIPSPQNRKISTGLVFVFGLVIGVVCYLLAEALIPSHVTSPGEHDIFLANRLGFIYTPMVGLWLGWLQRSWRRAVFGVVLGMIVGFIYMRLCASWNFLAIMVGFPCLLGCVFAAVLGSNRSHWLTGLAGRLGKGLLAGLVLGFVYMVVLNVGGAMVRTQDARPDDFAASYVRMMWLAGPIALGISSALFFILIRWAVGLIRIRPIVEDVNALDSEDTNPAR